MGLSNLGILALCFSLFPIAQTIFPPLKLVLCVEGVRDATSVIVVLLGSSVFSLLTLLNVSYFTRTRDTPSTLLRHLFLVALLLFLAVNYIWTTPISPLYAAGGLVGVLSILMKCHSYTLTNIGMANMGGKEKERGGTAVQWPSNVSLKDFLSFLVLPTLTYESSFPRTTHIRWTFVILKLLQGALCQATALAILFNFLVPVLEDPTPSTALTPGLPSFLIAPASIVMDLIRLSLPSIAIWLCGFVGFFSCFLGVLAEVTQYGDRCFYGCWWNANTLGGFWSSWNLPVHVFAKRHLLLETQLYFRLRKRGAILLTFLASAILHELVLSVAFKTIRPWFFLAMLSQIPLIVLSRSVQGVGGREGATASRWGNVFVWVSLYLGQPVLELLYCREFLANHSKEEILCFKGK